MESKENPILAKPFVTTRQLIKESWDVFTSRWTQLSLLELFAILPAMLFAGIIAFVGFLIFVSSDQFAISSDSISNPAIVLIAILSLIAIVGVAVLMFWGTCTKIVYLKHLRDGSSIRQALKESWDMLRGFVGVGLLQVLLVLGGLILLIIPGIYLMIKVLFSQYVYVFERDRGVRGITALKRSFELTRGFWWGIATRILVFSIFIGLIQMVVRALLTAGSEASAVSGSQALVGVALVIVAVVSLIVSLVTQALNSVFQFTLFERVYQMKRDDSSAQHRFSTGKRVGLIVLVILLPLLFMVVSILAIINSGGFSPLLWIRN